MLRRTKGGPLEPISWDEALDLMASKFRHSIDTFGPNSVAWYGSGQCLTEESYLANKIFKGGFGTNNVDGNPRLCMFMTLRHGARPAKILFLAERAFAGTYDRATIGKWLGVFIRRFFSQQFKRSSMRTSKKTTSTFSRAALARPSARVEAAVAAWPSRVTTRARASQMVWSSSMMSTLPTSGLRSLSFPATGIPSQ